MYDIILQPSEVWDYCEENKDDLQKEMQIIAQDKTFGVEVCVECKEDGRPIFSVYEDDERVYEDFGLNKPDCEATVKDIYNRYIYDVLQSTVESELDGYDDGFMNEIDIKDREIELDEAVEDFLWAVLKKQTATDIDEEKMEDIKDHFLEYLYRKHGINVYRPMYLEDEDGSEFFEEYPYESMIFDDPDNPMYK